MSVKKTQKNWSLERRWRLLARYIARWPGKYVFKKQTGKMVLCAIFLLLPVNFFYSEGLGSIMF